jgi:putative membrane protein
MAWALAAASLSRTAFAQAQQEVAGLDMGHIVRGTVETVIFAVLGIALLALGYKVFARLVPWNVDDEISKDHNVAAGIVLGALFVSIALVISAVLLS